MRIRISYFTPKETWVCELNEHGVTLWFEEAIGRLIDIDHMCLRLHYNCHSTLLSLKDKISDNQSDSDTGYHTPPDTQWSESPKT